MAEVVFIPGDGIGPSIVDAVRRIIDATGASIDVSLSDEPTEWASAGPQPPSLELVTPKNTGVFGAFLAREWKF